MLPPAGMLAAAGQAFISAVPTGKPSNGSLYRYGGDRIGVQWTNGDPSSSTEIRYKDTVAGCPALPIESNTTFKGIVGPGVTTFETGDPDSGEQCSYFIAHKKGGVYSAWHQVTTKINEDECLACAV